MLSMRERAVMQASILCAKSSMPRVREIHSLPIHPFICGCTPAGECTDFVKHPCSASAHILCGAGLAGTCSLKSPFGKF